MKNNKKKIIFVSQALWIGGIETALVNLINKLDYNKYDVTCLITENYLDMAERLTKNCRLIVADRHSLASLLYYNFLFLSINGANFGKNTANSLLLERNAYEDRKRDVLCKGL